MLDSAVVSTALLYAAPVLIVGFAIRKGWLVMLTAVLVAVLGLAIGDPRYLLADLAAVLVVLGAALLRGRRRRSVRRADAASHAAGTPPRWAWLWDVIGVLVVGWILFQTWKIDPPPAASGSATERNLRRATGADAVRPDGTGPSRVRALSLPREEDLRHCLELGSPEAVRACAERG